jgi:hypothetical protein
MVNSTVVKWLTCTGSRSSRLRWPAPLHPNGVVRDEPEDSGQQPVLPARFVSRLADRTMGSLSCARYKALAVYTIAEGHTHIPRWDWPGVGRYAQSWDVSQSLTARMAALSMGVYVLPHCGGICHASLRLSDVVDYGVGRSDPWHAWQLVDLQNRASL